jgi:predicted hydrolase (HD superfamily)
VGGVRTRPSCQNRIVSLVAMPAPSRDEAWELFCEWTESESLRRHVLGVETAMVAYAERDGEDTELWAATGILHDLDYEKHPDLETGHPRVALALFEERGYPAG